MNNHNLFYEMTIPFVKKQKFTYLFFCAWFTLFSNFWVLFCIIFTYFDNYSYILWKIKTNYRNNIQLSTYN